MENNVRIRLAESGDAESLLAIYAPYVRSTAITFEYEVPTEEEFRARILQTLERYPYLVAETGDGIVGYACAGAFHPRAAYDWAAETTVYVARDRRRMGLGGRLYRALETCLTAQGILNANACIAYPRQEDEYLTGDSVRFHLRFDYRVAGQFHDCGYKFGRWYDVVWMEKALGPHPAEPAAVRPFADVRGVLDAL